MFGVHIFSECVWVHWEDEELMFNTINCSLKCFQMKIIFKDATDSEFACDLAAAPQLSLSVWFYQYFLASFLDRDKLVNNKDSGGFFWFFLLVAANSSVLCLNEIPGWRITVLFVGASPSTFAKTLKQLTVNYWNSANAWIQKVSILLNFNIWTYIIYQ